MDLISIIIPVHNGEKYIKKTVLNILKQDYQNLEIVLVENFSSDNSLAICLELEEMDSRVRVTVCKDRGTSLARKKGVELANGKYILFSDQDDSLIDKTSIRKMHQAIIEDGTSFVQFGTWVKYSYGFKRKKVTTETKRAVTRAEMYNKEIAGIIGGKSVFTATVWSKIYETKLLKSAVQEISEPLYFAEDVNLCTMVIFDGNFKNASVRPEAYYIWSAGTGFSSNYNSGEALMQDYKIVKKRISQLANLYDVPQEIIFNMHLESLYFKKVFIESLIENKMDRKCILDKIDEISKYVYICEAKKFICGYDEDKKWEELKFMSSDYNSETYLSWCEKNFKRTSKQKLVRLLSLICKKN